MAIAATFATGLMRAIRLKLAQNRLRVNAGAITMLNRQIDNDWRAVALLRREQVAIRAEIEKLK